MPPHYKIVDLFTGTGAFSSVFKNHGCQCVFANDMVKESEEIYGLNNNPQHFKLEDLHQIPVNQIPSHDILCGGFPCFVAGTKVLTNSGYKNIEEVTFTDTLMTHTGKFQNILNLQKKQYSGPLYQIKTEYHPVLKCTEEHPFYVREKTPHLFKSPEWKKANELNHNHYLGMKINEHDNPPDNTSLHHFTDLSSSLTLQRLYLKMGRFFQIHQKSGSFQLLEAEKPTAFIEDGYAWFPLSHLETQSVQNITVYNFEVEHDNSYIVQNIIAHNCQPFSIAGKQEGFDDERSNVFWKIIEILKKHRPRIIILENVKNLTSHDKGKTFKVIEKNLKDVGYHLKYSVLDTSKITHIPQHRERIYIVGFLDLHKSNQFNFDFPTKSNLNLHQLLENQVNEKYYYTDKLAVYPTVSSEITKHINTNTVYQYRRYYVRENKSNCCPTLTANMGSGGHNVPLIKDDHGIRKLTPRECFNLQGFPKNYKLPAISDSKLYKLAGNAVSIPVIDLIIKKIISLS